MKKICIMAYNLTQAGGGERVAFTLANELSDYYSVSMVSILKGSGIPRYEKKENVGYYSLVKENERLRKLAVKSFFEVKKYLKKNKIDVVLIIGTYTGFLSLAVRPFVSTKFVFCDHSSIENQWNHKKFTTMRRMAVKFADYIVTLTESSKEFYLKRLNARKDRVICIYNYIDEKCFEHVDKYDITSKKIITVGRLSPEKGFDSLLDIACIVFQKHPDWEWDIYGNGEMYNFLEKGIKEKGLVGKVILQGEVKSTYDIYKKYAFFVLTSYREGLPLVLLEAKVNRLPLVSFDVMTGPNEIIRNNKDGYLIPVKDINAMAEKINSLIVNTDLRKKFSENSYDNISSFEKDVIIPKWRNLIDRL